MSTPFKVPKAISRKEPSSKKELPSRTEVAETDDGESNETKESPEAVSAKLSPAPIEENIPYNEPSWGSAPEHKFQLLVIKNGVEIDSVDISGKSFHSFGRLPGCDVMLEHPSVSRYHAVLQYRLHGQETQDVPTGVLLKSTTPQDPGFYVYDLGSTHGTFLNKQKLLPRCYYQVRVGQGVRFGGSSRLFILEQVGENLQEMVEAEAEAERADILMKKRAYQLLVEKAEREKELAEKEQEKMGATWGMVMDDMGMNPDKEGEEMLIDPEKEAYYASDPKQALRKFFEREGLELEYETEESGPPRARTFTVRVRLPIDTLSGEPVYAEAAVRGKKKEAVVQCALNACRMLDAEDILRESRKAQKRKEKNWEENDYYDSDEDNFFDRTGDVERKRLSRMKKAGKVKDVETFASLSAKLAEVSSKLEELQNKLDQEKQGRMSHERVDSLDAFMSSVGTQLDSSKRMEIKLQLHHLRKEEQHLQKLIKVARPYDLPQALHEPLPSPEPIPKPHSPSESTSRVEVKPESPVEVVRHAGPDDQSKGAKLDSGSGENTDNSQRKEQPERPPPPDLQSPPPTAKRRRVMGPFLPPSAARHRARKKSQPKQFEEEQDSEDYSSWLPPEGQSGDGRTQLNDKFGY